MQNLPLFCTLLFRRGGQFFRQARAYRSQANVQPEQGNRMMKIQIEEIVIEDAAGQRPQCDVISPLTRLGSGRCGTTVAPAADEQCRHDDGKGGNTHQAHLAGYRKYKLATFALMSGVVKPTKHGYADEDQASEYSPIRICGRFSLRIFPLASRQRRVT
jgi:hypothetical protein